MQDRNRGTHAEKRKAKGYTSQLTWGEQARELGGNLGCWRDYIFGEMKAEEIPIDRASHRICCSSPGLCCGRRTAMGPEV